MNFEDTAQKTGGSEESEVIEVEVIDDDSPSGLADEDSVVDEITDSGEGHEEHEALHVSEAEVLRDEVSHLREMYLRKLAEFDNFRKRIERERDELKRTATEEIVLDLIPVLDNFERALEQVVDAETGAFRQGVDMISRQLRGVLENRGLEEFDPMGQPFRPELHEAVRHVDDSDLPPGTVAWVLAKGFLYGGRLVRPAMVGVTRERPNGDQAPATAVEAEEESVS